MSELLAYHSAVNYLRKFLSAVEYSIFVSGHSMGGNLAIYASSKLPVGFQEKIIGIYCLRGILSNFNANRIKY